MACSLSTKVILTWVLLRAETATNDFINPSENLTALLTENRQYLTQSGAQFKITGSALFAADAKQKSRKRKHINERTRREFNVIIITDCLSYSSYFMAIFADSNWNAFRCRCNRVGIWSNSYSYPCYWDQSRRCIN